jgi:hypothetical protein
MRGPVAACALAPGVGDAAGVGVAAQLVIGPGDPLPSFGPRLQRQRWQRLEEQEFGIGRIIELEQGIERHAQLVGGRLPLHGPGALPPGGGA